MLPLILCPLTSDRNFIVRAGTAAVQIDEEVFARHSEVLSNLMQSAPRRPPGALTVLVLTDDGQDLLRYVDHVYNPIAVANAPIALDALRSFLYMGRKYDPDLFYEMSSVIGSEFPPIFRYWDSARNAQFTLITWTAGIEFDLLDVVYQYDLYTVKPSLLYRICCSLTSCFFKADRYQGIMRSDGTRATLSLKQQQVCEVAIRRLAIAQTSYTLKWLQRGEIPVLGCTTVSDCHGFVSRTLVEIDGSPRAIRPLEDWDERWNGELCLKCERHAKRTHRHGRRK
ncbi:hypothetical protein FPV67DRAFT_1455066, partial [Lyophyllum atratum]